MKTTAERCTKFLQSRGTTRNWQLVVMYNYGGRLVAYEGDLTTAVYSYHFDDDSFIDVHCFYETGMVKVLIKDNIVTTICSNYMKF